jgi:hypothetical protein
LLCSICDVNVMHAWQTAAGGSSTSTGAVGQRGAAVHHRRTNTHPAPDFWQLQEPRQPRAPGVQGVHSIQCRHARGRCGELKITSYSAAAVGSASCSASQGQLDCPFVCSKIFAVCLDLQGEDVVSGSVLLQFRPSKCTQPTTGTGVLYAVKTAK